MTQQPIAASVLVIHVSKGYEERLKHIERLSALHRFKYTLILDGDKDTLTASMLSKWFSEDMLKPSGAVSCAYKHLLAYRHIIENSLPGALILEDDVVLFRKFNETFNRSLKELSDRGITQALISYEDSRLRFVERSRRIKGQLLYDADKDRFAACYYITHEAAQLLLDKAEQDKIHQPIDIFHASCIKEFGLNYMWCQPAIASQGTNYGKFASGISTKHYSRYSGLKWKIKLNYRKLLYFLR